MYFIVRNCIFSSYMPRRGGAIRFDSVQNGQVENCEAYALSSLSYIKNCNNCAIVSSNFKWSDGGMIISLSSNCLIEGNSVKEIHYEGIKFIESNSCVVRDNEVSDIVVGRGIQLERSDFSEITDNTIWNCYEEGLWLKGCDNSTVSGNNVRFSGEHKSDYYLPGAAFYIQSSDFQVISSNEVSNNSMAGMYLDISESTIENNVVFGNIENGISVDGRRDTIVGNLIYENGGVGLALGSCISCLIYDNNIGYNLEGNAIDGQTIASFANQWDDGVSIGNGWSDYSGSGTYTVSGFGDAIDHYPRQFSHETGSTDIDDIVVLSVMIASISAVIVLIVGYALYKRR